MAESLRIYRSLARLMPDDAVVEPDDPTLMASGRCALGFSWSGVTSLSTAGHYSLLAIGLGKGCRAPVYCC